LIKKDQMFKPQKKDQYALRAIYELARQKGKGPIKVAEIADAQHIPRRFLEVILNQLKGSGLIASKRGFTGGYVLVRAPAEITVGEIFHFMQGGRKTLFCAAGEDEDHCQLYGDCALAPFWQRVQEAVYRICDETTIQDLLDNEQGTMQPTAADRGLSSANPEEGP
jgi:Rrf2 family protein